MPKKKAKVTEPKKAEPISINITVNDDVFDFKTENILQTLNEFKYDKTIKTLVRFTVSYKNKQIVRILGAMKMRQIQSTLLFRQILAKKLNMALGI